MCLLNSSCLLALEPVSHCATGFIHNWDHWVSALLLLIDSGGVLTSSPVPLRLYPQFTAMSKGCISVQPSAVQVLERLPGVWEDMQRSKPPRQQISLLSAQRVSLNVSNTPVLRDLR